VALARRGEGSGGFRGGVHQDRCVVAQDSGEDLFVRWIRMKFVQQIKLLVP
jgi:hypothetical protein